MIVTNLTQNCRPKYTNCTFDINGQVIKVAVVEIYQRLPSVEVSMDIKLSLSPDGEFNYRRVYKRSIDLCKFYGNRRREIMLNYFYSEISEIGHWPQKCPIEPVHAAYFERFLEKNWFILFFFLREFIWSKI